MIMIGEEVITEEEVNKMLEDFKEKYSNLLTSSLNENFSFNKVLINNTKKRYDSCIPLKL